MAQYEPVDPLSEFDALLTKELSVTPSPEFLPQVRERIRLEPARSRWSLSAVRSSLSAVRWSLVAQVAAVALIVLAVGLHFWNAADAPVPPPASVASTTPPVEPPARVPNPEPRIPSPEPPVPSPTPPRSALRWASRGHSLEPHAEVIVDQRQRAALVSMLRLINQGRLTENSFKNTTPAPAEIGVDPVVVSPIVVVGVLPSESDRK